MKANLVVVFGGNSVEHEVSIITAIQAMENLDYDKYNVIPVFLSKEGLFYSHESFFRVDTFKDHANIKPSMQVNFKKEEGHVKLYQNKHSIFSKGYINNVDMIFPIVHGTNVEDGKLQGFFETLDLPIIGTTTTSGVIGQDKAIMKDILKAHGIAQTNYMWVLESDDTEEKIDEIINAIGNEVIIKPAELGSSVGIKVAHTKEGIRAAIDQAYQYSNKIIVEELLFDFQEINISVVGNYKEYKVSITEEVSKNDEILSYEDKYLSGNKNKVVNSGMASLKRNIPANVDGKIIDQIENIAKTCFRVLNCNGVIRIDLMVVENQVFVNEINNIPGSLAFYLWEAIDINYQQLLDFIIETSIDTFYTKKSKTYSINTNILASLGSKL